jgi:chitin disaccharide deacetylase
MLIINADDFGASRVVNAAIMEGFDKEIISSATIMATMEGFEEACQLVHDRHLESCVGVHLVLTDGMPLTDFMKRQRTFCTDDGYFRGQINRYRYFGAEERKALATEMEAQILRCRTFGLALTHADSHHHTHTAFGISGVVIDVCRGCRVPFVRLSRNIGDMSRAAKAIKFMHNLRLHACGLSRSRYFGSVKDVAYEQTMGRNGTFIERTEVMLHPTFSDDGRLVERRTGEGLVEAIRTTLAGHACFSYSGRRMSEIK